MISKKVLKNLEYDKILEKTSNYAVLNKTKNLIKVTMPTTSYKQAQSLLDKTEQASKLLFEYGISGITYYDEIDNQLLICQKGGVLTFGELLAVSKALASFRVLKNSIVKVELLGVDLIKEIAERKGALYCPIFEKTYEKMLEMRGLFREDGLHYSFDKGHHEIAKIILEFLGVEDIPDEFNKTPENDELEKLVSEICPTAEFNRTMLAEEYRQSISTTEVYSSDYTLAIDEDE